MYHHAWHMRAVWGLCHANVGRLRRGCVVVIAIVVDRIERFMAIMCVTACVCMCVCAWVCQHNSPIVSESYLQCRGLIGPACANYPCLSIFCARAHYSARQAVLADTFANWNVPNLCNTLSILCVAVEIVIADWTHRNWGKKLFVFQLRCIKLSRFLSNYHPLAKLHSDNANASGIAHPNTPGVNRACVAPPRPSTDRKEF